MIMIRHELKQNRISLAAWTAAVGFLLVICILIFPEMKEEMDGVSDMFASMGSFTEAFGMDKISFGTLTGFYAVECGNILGLGGAFSRRSAGCPYWQRRKRPYGGISPDPSGQPCPDRDLQAGRGGAADRDPECGHLCGFHRLHCGDWEEIPWKRCRFYIWPICCCRSRSRRSASGSPPF